MFKLIFWPQAALLRPSFTAESKSGAETFPDPTASDRKML
jgi:hypothetical protein